MANDETDLSDDALAARLALAYHSTATSIGVTDAETALLGLARAAGMILGAIPVADKMRLSSAFKRQVDMCVAEVAAHVGTPHIIIPPRLVN